MSKSPKIQLSGSISLFNIRPAKLPSLSRPWETTARRRFSLERSSFCLITLLQETQIKTRAGEEQRTENLLLLLSQTWSVGKVFLGLWFSLSFLSAWKLVFFFFFGLSRLSIISEFRRECARLMGKWSQGRAIKMKGHLKHPERTKWRVFG